MYTLLKQEGSGKLIGCYEKHEYRNRETAEFYAID